MKTKAVTPAPAPLDHEPRSVRAPYDVRDDRFDHLWENTEAWRVAVRLDRVLALRECWPPLSVQTTTPSRMPMSGT